MITQMRMSTSLCYKCKQLYPHHRLTVQQNCLSLSQQCSLHNSPRIHYVANYKTKNWKFKPPAYCYTVEANFSDFPIRNPASTYIGSLTMDPEYLKNSEITTSDLYTSVIIERFKDSEQCSMMEESNSYHSNLQCSPKNWCSKKYLHLDKSSCSNVSDKFMMVEKTHSIDEINSCDKNKYVDSENKRQFNNSTCKLLGKTSSNIKFLCGNLTKTNAVSKCRSLLQTFNKSARTFYCKFHSSTRNDILHELDVKKTDIPVKLSPPWKILFFGTDEIALHTLENLYKNMTTSGSLVESLDVVTIKQKHAVYRFAERVNLPLQEWPIKVNNNKYDVGILVSFGHLIPDKIIHMFPYGILNMHPSLLPRWRGASPIIHTILNDDLITGVSIMEIRPKHFDIGPLLLQREIQVPSRCTSNQLRDITGHLGSNMVLECLKDLPTLERFEHEQDSDGITYAHKLKHSDGYIDWDNHTSHQIDCQYRAIHELMPIRTQLNGKSIKLTGEVDPSLFTDAIIEDIKGYKGNYKLSPPGTVVYHSKLDCIVVKCKDGFIGFKNITVKMKMTARDFYNGFIQKNDQTLFTSCRNNLNKFTKQEKLPLKSKAL